MVPDLAPGGNSAQLPSSMKESKGVLLAASKKVVRQPKLATLLPSVNAAYLPGADETLPLSMTGLSLSPVLFLSPLVQQCTLAATLFLRSCYCFFWWQVKAQAPSQTPLTGLTSPRDMNTDCEHFAFGGKPCRGERLRSLSSLAC